MYMTARRGRDANARKIRNDPWSRFSHATKGHLCSILVSNIIFGYPPFHGLSFAFFHTLLETFTFSFISLTRIPFVFFQAESFQKTSGKWLCFLRRSFKGLSFGLITFKCSTSCVFLGFLHSDLSSEFYLDLRFSVSDRRLNQSRSSYFAIGLYLLDVTIVYHTFLQIAISKIYEYYKKVLFKMRNFGDFGVFLLLFTAKCDIIKR